MEGRRRQTRPLVALVFGVVVGAGCAPAGSAPAPSPSAAVATAPPVIPAPSLAVAPTGAAPTPGPAPTPGRLGWLDTPPAGYAVESGWIRPHPGPFVWGRLATTDGGPRWDQADALVRTWQAQGQTILATIWPYADFDQERCHAAQPETPNFLGVRKVYAPCDRAAYARWLTALVRRYAGIGADAMPGLRYPLRYWEIINEPDQIVATGPLNAGEAFFRGTTDEYVDILRLSADSIRAADPEAKIVLGGSSGMLPDRLPFWSAVIKSAPASFDIANDHCINCPSDDFWAADYRAYLDALGRSDRPFFITEALVGGRPAPTEDEAARQTFTRTAAALANGAAVVFFGGVQLGSSGGPDNKLHTAANEAFKILARAISSASEARIIGRGAARLVTPSGTVYVLWDGASLPPEVKGTVTVTTYAGATAQVAAASVRATMPLLVVTR